MTINYYGYEIKIEAKFQDQTNYSEYATLCFLNHVRMMAEKASENATGQIHLEYKKCAKELNPYYRKLLEEIPR